MGLAKMRRCKCGCSAELPAARQCTDILSKKGYASAECLMLHTRAKAKAKAEKEARQRNAALRKKVKANPKAKALEAAQLLARISRADDDGNCTCVTCGHVGKWNDGFDGGHFIAKGSCSFWMLDPCNIWPQCKGCNGFSMKHGSAPIKYTSFMIDWFGREFVEHMLDNTKTIIKRSATDYEEYLVYANSEINIHKKRLGIK